MTLCIFRETGLLLKNGTTLRIVLLLMRPDFDIEHKPQVFIYQLTVLFCWKGAWLSV